MLDSLKERWSGERLTAALAADPDDETQAERDWCYLRGLLSGLPSKGGKAVQRMLVESAWRIRKRLIAAGEYRPQRTERN